MYTKVKINYTNMRKLSLQMKVYKYRYLNGYLF